MSTTIDERVVRAKFDNAQFQKGVKETMTSLEQLDKKLNLTGAAKGLEGISAAANKVNLGPVSSGIDALVSKFNTLSIVGITAITNIANRAVDAGLQIAKSLTIAPVQQGFSEYEMKLGAIQTIMAGSGESLATVNKQLEILNHYADTTIYSFADMTQNIGKFTNAGVSLNDSVAAIKGVANVAAISGANAEEASRAMYNFSQSLSQGFVGLADWKSIELANMGTKEFKQQLIDSAVAAGTLTKQSNGMYKTLSGKTLSATKDFNLSLQEQWLTSEALTATLGRYSDKTTDIGRRAAAAAQDVKSFSQFMDTLKEGIGSGWATTFELLFGNLEESKKLWTSVNNVVGGFVGSMSDARNKVLADWKALGGRTDLLEGIKNIFNAIIAVVKPVRDAFREIFPAKTGKDLAEFTKGFREFTEKLKIGAEVSDGLKSTFKGIFAIFSIVGKIIGGVAHAVASFFGAISGGTGSIWTLTGSIGDLIVKLNAWLEKGKYIDKFFQSIAMARANVLKPVIDFISRIVHALGTLISGDTDGFFSEIGNSVKAFIPLADAFEKKFRKIYDAIKGVYDLVINGDFTANFRRAFGVEEDAPIISTILNIRNGLMALPALVSGFFSGFTGGGAAKATAGVDGLNKVLENSAKIGDSVKGTWESISETFKNVQKSLSDLASGFEPALDAIKKKFQDFFKNLGVNEGLALVNTGFFIAFYTMMRKFFKNVNGLVDSIKGSFDSISDVLGQVTDNLKTMQTDVRSDIILKIAGSLALLAIAIAILASIDPAKLGVALGAVAIMLGELIGALALLEKYTTFKGAVQMTVLSAALVGLGVAMLALSAAIAIFGNMDWVTLAKGLGTMAVVLGLLVGASALLEKSGGTKRLVAVAVALGIMAFALTAFAGAVKLYEAIDPATLLNGGLKIVAVMAAIGLVMRAFPENSLQSAASLLIVSAALVILAGAMKAFSTFDGGDVATSLIMLAGSLYIISAALRSMEGTLKGSAALLVAVAAINMLVPALYMIGSMDMETIERSLIGLAGALAILVLAGAASVYVAPGLLALGQAIALMGLGALAAGLGLLAFSAGLAALAATGAAGVAVLIGSIVAIAEIFPLIMQQVGLGLIALAKVISESGPVLVAAFTTVLISLIQAVGRAIPEFAKTVTIFIMTMLKVIDIVAPKIIDTLMRLIWKLVDTLTINVPKFVNAGMKLILGILEGFRDNLPKIVTVVGDLISRFIRALGDNGLKIINAAADTILKFMNGLAKSIRDNSKAFGKAGGDILAAIVEGLVGGVGAFAGTLWRAAQRIGSQFMDGIKSFFGINSPSRLMREMGGYVMEGFGLGLDEDKGVRKAFGNLERVVDDSLARITEDKGGHAMIDSLRKSISGLGDVVDGNLELRPVISPVLDLTDVQRDARKLDALVPALSVAPGYRSARSAQAAYNANQNAADSEGVPFQENVENTTYIQNNYSPKALSSADIYRQTKNQLSVVKGALTNA